MEKQRGCGKRTARGHGQQWRPPPMECQPPARHCSRRFLPIFMINLSQPPWRRDGYFTHFTDEEPEGAGQGGIGAGK